MTESKTYLADCMNPETGIPSFRDKYFDLAVVDPEFGIGIGHSPRLVTDKGLHAKTWDDKPIDQNYFIEIFRVSKNQIVWGGNYYVLPPTSHCIIWDKKQPEEFSFGMFDYAWTSFNGGNKIFRHSVQEEKNKIHPTQKPIALYDWIYKRYAQPGMKVLDTHLGSGSNRISAYKAGMDFTAFELDPDYFAAQEERFRKFLIEYGTPDPSKAIPGQQINLF